MSSRTRTYELKARAVSQRETRDRIAAAAAELHEEVGVLRTTVAEIARRAGVTRLTVYNHFPDLEALLPACSAHYERQHPFPDVAATLAIEDPQRRVAETLALLYGWYRGTESMFSTLFSDRAHVPELDRLLENGIDRMQVDLGRALADSLGQAREVAVLLRLAVDFWTWRRLDHEGLDDEAAAQLMAATIIRR